MSPRVVIDQPDRLLLDITGCAHLFGGEQAMGDHDPDRISDIEIISKIGIADTKDATRDLLVLVFLQSQSAS